MSPKPIRAFIIGLIASAVSLPAQSGWDYLTLPLTAGNAGLGQTLDAANRPTLTPLRKEYQLQMTLWQWTAGIQGVNLYVPVGRWGVHFRSLTSGELEYRNEIPTREPLSTFSYNYNALGVSRAFTLGKWQWGISAALLWEQTLDASAWGMSLGAEGSHKLGNWQMALGFRNLGRLTALSSEASTLPTEAYLHLSRSVLGLDWEAELRSSRIPLAMGTVWHHRTGLALTAGVQLVKESNQTTTYFQTALTFQRPHWSLGYGLYQLNHPVQARRYLSFAFVF